MLKAEDICFHLARRMLPRMAASKSEAERERAADATAYAFWRASELQRELSGNFDLRMLKDCDVLDFGCGEGELSFLAANLGVRSITGTELNRNLVAAAQAQAEMRSGAAKPVFVHASDHTTIDFPENSFDVILCFDVMEHVIEYRPIIAEWRRVLRPGGRVLISWQPWFHPYGHHIRRLVPIPWAHVFFSESVLVRTCARIYDLSEYEPRSGEVDANGAKRPNRWNQIERLDELNRLTTTEFENACSDARLRIVKRRWHGLWQGTPLGALTQALTRVPRIRDFFCSSAVYELGK